MKRRICMELTSDDSINWRQTSTTHFSFTPVGDLDCNLQIHRSSCFSRWDRDFESPVCRIYTSRSSRLCSLWKWVARSLLSGLDLIYVCVCQTFLLFGLWSSKCDHEADGEDFGRLLEMEVLFQFCRDCRQMWMPIACEDYLCVFLLSTFVL